MHKSNSGEEVHIWNLPAKEIIDNADEGFAIPTFVEFCRFMKELIQPGSDFKLYVELKIPKLIKLQPTYDYQTAVKKTFNIVYEEGIQDSVVWVSFCEKSLDLVRELATEREVLVKTGQNIWIDFNHSPDIFAKNQMISLPLQGLTEEYK